MSAIVNDFPAIAAALNKLQGNPTVIKYGTIIGEVCGREGCKGIVFSSVIVNICDCVDCQKRVACCICGWSGLKIS